MKSYRKGSENENKKTPDSPELASCDFSLFPEPKSPLRGRRFEPADTIKKNATKQLIPILKEDFADSFEKWKGP